MLPCTWAWRLCLCWCLCHIRPGQNPDRSPKIQQFYTSFQHNFKTCLQFEVSTTCNLQRFIALRWVAKNYEYICSTFNWEKRIRISSLWSTCFQCCSNDLWWPSQEVKCGSLPASILINGSLIVCLAAYLPACLFPTWLNSILDSLPVSLPACLDGLPGRLSASLHGSNVDQAHPWWSASLPAPIIEQLYHWRST